MAATLPYIVPATMYVHRQTTSNQFLLSVSSLLHEPTLPCFPIVKQPLNTISGLKAADQSQMSACLVVSGRCWSSAADEGMAFPEKAFQHSGSPTVCQLYWDTTYVSALLERLDYDKNFKAANSHAHVHTQPPNYKAINSIHHPPMQSGTPLSAGLLHLILNCGTINNSF